MCGACAVCPGTTVPRAAADTAASQTNTRNTCLLHTTTAHCNQDPVSHVHQPSLPGDQVVREGVTAMKFSTIRRLATVLLLIAAVAGGAAGCVFVPYPAGGDYGHYGHGEQDGRPYRR